MCNHQNSVTLFFKSFISKLILPPMCIKLFSFGDVYAYAGQDSEIVDFISPFFNVSSQKT